MVKAHLDYYYTFKQLTRSIYECHKWEEFADVPSVTYQVFPFGGPGNRGSCGCPAFKRCKHLKALDEILTAGRESQLPGLKWTAENGWEEAEL